MPRAKKKPEPTFKLKCVLGHLDERPAYKCQGNMPPSCKECGMPMILEEVINK